MIFNTYIYFCVEDELDPAALELVKDKVRHEWLQMKNVKMDEALKQYMAIVSKWKGHGATLYDVEVRGEFVLSDSLRLFECRSHFFFELFFVLFVRVLFTS